METLPYLGLTIAYNNSDWAAVYLNLHKAQRRWGMATRVLESTGSTVRNWGTMHKSVVQFVPVYGRERWVVTGEMLRVLTGFHHWAAQWITGMMAKRGAGGEWEYPSVEEEM